MALFRKEAVAYKNRHNIGQAYLYIPRSYKVFSLFLLSITLIFIVILYIGDYSRKEKVSGLLVSTSGVIHIYAPRSGVVSDLYVNHNDVVNTGKSLLTIQSPTHLTSGQSLNKQLKRSLENQLSMFEKQIKSERLLSNSNRESILASIDEREKAIVHLNEQAKMSNELISVKRQQYARAIKMFDKGHLTDNEKNNSYHQLLLQMKEKEQTAQLLSTQQAALKQSKLDLSRQPLLVDQSIAQLKRNISEINLRLTNIKAQDAVNLNASIDARIASLQVHKGQHIESGQLLITLLPSNSLIEAELYLPSKASGFVVKGQQVRLRYTAFPYQRYGIFNGEVISMNKTILNPHEMRVPLALQEAVYKVRVKLEKQSVKAFGKNHQLLPGMSLEADLVLDNMSIFDWIMMPIYSLKGKF